MEWLRADLEANPRQCTLAYWHAPLFSSGLHGGYQAVRPFWQVLSEYGADLILTGHDHNYERFAPQDPWGNPDPEKGIRQFVIGTGGGGWRSFGEQIAANSEVRLTGTYGVLKLTLYSGGYDWEFIPVEGGAITDTGSDVCR
jgi:acid phosphatase type 7